MSCPAPSVPYLVAPFTVVHHASCSSNGTFKGTKLLALSSVPGFNHGQQRQEVDWKLGTESSGIAASRLPGS